MPCVFTANAVNPPPDGGYPGVNTAEGQNALLSLDTSGFANTAVGSFSLQSQHERQFQYCCRRWNACTSTQETTIRPPALQHSCSTPLANNTANGTAALVNNSTGEDNTAVGAFALNSNTASSNTAIGSNALQTNITGTANTAAGALALFSNTDGNNNTATGLRALRGNTTGEDNTAIGASALNNNTAGIGNTAIGSSALGGNDTGSSNTAVGDDALGSPVGHTGSGNTAVGHNALFAPLEGPGDNNTAIGVGAGGSLGEFESNNIDIGFGVAGVPGDSNTIRIGNEDITATFIKGISGATVVSGATVLVGANGHLGTVTSSKRFKEEIKPMDKASRSALFAQTGYLPLQKGA